MRLYNTMTRKTEDLVPMHHGRLNVFVCGPTVYNRIHVGNGRTFAFFDAAVKFLRFIGYSVFYLQNITDIDDKIINRASEEGVDPLVLSKKYFRDFIEDTALLGIDSVTYYALASDYIPEIRRQVSSLLRRHFAYRMDDGIYFSIDAFPDYGKLSRQVTAENRSSVRHRMNENKRNPGDFVVWKLAKPGEPKWPSPYGEGRPGWNVEDTAITRTFFGDSYDIHGGGSDLIFPHHEGEIAIMRSLSNRKYLSRYWLHTGMLNIKDEKMSKSAGNIITVREACEKYGGLALRYLLLNASYRSEIIFDELSMHEAKVNVDRLNLLYQNLKSRSDFGDLNMSVEGYRERVIRAASNDFDFRSVYAILNELSEEVNKNMESVSHESTAKILDFIEDVNSFLGFIDTQSDFAMLDKLMENIISFRHQLRAEKEFSLADQLREKLKDAGIELEDKGGMTKWRKRQ